MYSRPRHAVSSQLSVQPAFEEVLTAAEARLKDFFGDSPMENVVEAANESRGQAFIGYAKADIIALLGGDQGPRFRTNRFNPRPLSSTHVNRIYRAISCKNRKAFVAENAIRIAVHKDQIASGVQLSCHKLKPLAWTPQAEGTEVDIVNGQHRVAATVKVIEDLLEVQQNVQKSMGKGNPATTAYTRAQEIVQTLDEEISEMRMWAVEIYDIGKSLCLVPRRTPLSITPCRRDRSIATPGDPEAHARYQHACDAQAGLGAADPGTDPERAPGRTVGTSCADRRALQQVGSHFIRPPERLRPRVHGGPLPVRGIRDQCLAQEKEL